MTSVKLTPRQKMVNMMYLILIALLALNVSKEIIKTFNLIENSLDNSTKGIADKSMSIRHSIQKQADDGNASAKAALVHDVKTREIATRLMTTIKGIKMELENRTKGRIIGPDGELVKGGRNELVSGDNMEIHANYFVTEEGGKRGKDLQNLINQTRKDMLTVLDDAIADTILSADKHTRSFLLNRRNDIAKKSFLSAEDYRSSEGKQSNWVSTYLENAPLAGVFALLSKIENDTRFMEAEVSQALAESIGAKTIEVDTVMPMIRSSTSSLISGQPFEADIILAAYDSRSDMAMSVNGRPIEVNGGMGKYRSNTTEPGEYSFEVGINIPQPGGGFSIKKQTGKYSVFAPSAAISAEELNVLYSGLDNPLSITVAGVNPALVQVSVTGSDIQLINRGNGKYFARFPNRTSNECILTVNAKVGEKMMFMGSKKFRLRSIPRPVLKLGPIAFTDDIKISDLLIQTKATADLEGFIYSSVSYAISSYKFSYFSRTKGYDEKRITGNSLEGILPMIRKLKLGDEIKFSEIQALGPDGSLRRLSNVSATLR